MDIRPHPEKHDRAIVRIDDHMEEIGVVRSYSLLGRQSMLLRELFWSDEDDESEDSGEYPLEMELPHRQLGRVASAAMLGEHGLSLENARQIVDYFEGRRIEAGKAIVDAFERSQTA